MGANPNMRQRAWKRSVVVVLIIAALCILTAIVLQLTAQPGAGLILITGGILFLFALGMRWGISGMFPKK